MRLSMRACVVTALSCLTACLTTAAPARAEFEAGLFAGYRRFAETNRLGRFDRDPPETGYIPAPALGARFAWLPLRYLGGELQVAALPTGTKNDRTSATISDLRAHVIGTLPVGRFRPFALLGAGVAVVVPADPLYLRRDTDLQLHGGCGARFDVTPLWGVRAEGQVYAVPRTDAAGAAFDVAVIVGIFGNFPWPKPAPQPFDRDQDGIANHADECPDVPGEVRFGGCPAEPERQPAPDAVGGRSSLAHSPETTL